MYRKESELKTNFYYNVYSIIMATTTLFGAEGLEFIYILIIYYTGALIVSTILLIITIKKIV
jgi:hypothetical protein